MLGGYKTRMQLRTAAPPPASPPATPRHAPQPVPLGNTYSNSGEVSTHSSRAAAQDDFALSLEALRVQPTANRSSSGVAAVAFSPRSLQPLGRSTSASSSPSNGGKAGLGFTHSPARLSSLSALSARPFPSAWETRLALSPSRAHDHTIDCGRCAVSNSSVSAQW